jgi:8-oxo-dGTP pyrophosphatase MutT (NUDIX family)
MKDVMSEQREIATAIVIDTAGRFLLQQRDNVPGIVHPGKVGLFGGHREGSETFLECITRELHEELSYLIPSERFEHLSSYKGPDPGVGTLHAEFFVVREIPTDQIIVTEGTLLVVSAAALDDLEANLAPSAAIALKAYAEKYP